MMHVEIRLIPGRGPLSPWRWTRCEGPCSVLFREWTYGDTACAVAAARQAGCSPEAREAALDREAVLCHADMAVIASEIATMALMARIARNKAEIARLERNEVHACVQCGKECACCAHIVYASTDGRSCRSCPVCRWNGERAA